MPPTKNAAPVTVTLPLPVSAAVTSFARVSEASDWLRAGQSAIPREVHRAGRGQPVVTSRETDRAGRDRRGADERVRRRERERAGTLLRERAGAADDFAEREVVRAVDDESGRVRKRDPPGEAAGQHAVSEGERSRGHGRGAGMCAGICERERAGPGLSHRAASRNRPAKRERVGAVEGERGVVCDVACDGAGRGAVADRQRAARDRRAAIVGVGIRKRERAGATLRERAAAAPKHRGPRDGLAVGVGVVPLAGGRAEPRGVVELVRRGVLERAAGEDDRTSGRVGAERAARARGLGDAEREHAAGERRRAGITVGTREHGRAGAGLGERTAAEDHGGERAPLYVERAGRCECASRDRAARQLHRRHRDFESRSSEPPETRSVLQARERVAEPQGSARSLRLPIARSDDSVAGVPDTVVVPANRKVLVGSIAPRAAEDIRARATCGHRREGLADGRGERGRAGGAEVVASRPDRAGGAGEGPDRVADGARLSGHAGGVELRRRPDARRREIERVGVGIDAKLHVAVRISTLAEPGSNWHVRARDVGGKLERRAGIRRRAAVDELEIRYRLGIRHGLYTRAPDVHDAECGGSGECLISRILQ